VKDAKCASISVGDLGENNRPTEPWRWGERRDVPMWGSLAGVRPRATAITFVLPKKRLRGMSVSEPELLFFYRDGRQKSKLREWGNGGIPAIR